MGSRNSTTCRCPGKKKVIVDTSAEKTHEALKELQETHNEALKELQETHSEALKELQKTHNEALKKLRSTELQRDALISHLDCLQETIKRLHEMLEEAQAEARDNKAKLEQEREAIMKLKKTVTLLIEKLKKQCGD